MLTVNDPYGLAFRPAVLDAYKKSGGEIVSDITVASGLPSYAPEMQRIINAKPDGILAGTYTDDLRLQWKQLIAAGYKGKLFKLYPSSTPLNEDEGSEGRMFGLEGTWTDDDTNQEWQQRYKDKYGEDPSYWSAVGYDAVMLNAQAVASSKSDKAEDIRNAMVEAAKTYRGPTGELKFDDTFVRIDSPLAHYEVLDGEYSRVDENGQPLAN
jgi:branched-chain amino acid transport system substrate-binding protein